MTNKERKNRIPGLGPPLPQGRYHVIKASFRDPNGHRLCDLGLDPESGEAMISFKRGQENYTVPFRTLLEQFDELKKTAQNF